MFWITNILDRNVYHEYKYNGLEQVTKKAERAYHLIFYIGARRSENIFFQIPRGKEEPLVFACM